MTTYVIKVILCSAVFLLTHKLLLEKERMHIFNRFYLLSSLLLSFFIPLIKFSSSTPVLSNFENGILHKEILQDNRIVQILSPEQSTNYILSAVHIIYATITTILFFRFIVNIYKIFSKAWANQTIPYKNSKIVVINEDLTPHSFLNYLFINAKDYKMGNIENEILIHEYAHIQQKHSYDILFIEVLQTIFWFNPFMIFYRFAIHLNHEFLADEFVTNTSHDIKSYQYLLIDKASKSKTYNLTSQFNYSITKKRLLMMTKTKSLRDSLYKQIAIIPVLAFSIILFSTKSYAENAINVQKVKLNIIPSIQYGVTHDLLKDSMNVPTAKQNTLLLTHRGITQEMLNKIREVLSSPLPRIVPTLTQIESWKNSNIYGLWIDGKRVSNSKLNKYENTDFAHVSVSYVEKNARNFGKHYYQVDLMTNEEFEAYNKGKMEAKNQYKGN